MSPELIEPPQLPRPHRPGLVLAGTAVRRALPTRPAWAATAKVGEAAPGFTVNATNGSPVSLASYKGKVVVLEWTNHDCPYVRKHYDSSNMQGLQSEATGQGVVWLTVISSAPGHAGLRDAAAGRRADDVPQGGADRGPARHHGRDRQAVRRDQHAAHVRGRQGGHARLRRRHRRPADHPAAPTCRARTTTCGPRSTRSRPGQPVKTPVTRAYGCTVKYAYRMRPPDRAAGCCTGWRQRGGRRAASPVGSRAVERRGAGGHGRRRARRSWARCPRRRGKRAVFAVGDAERLTGTTCRAAARACPSRTCRAPARAAAHELMKA